MSIRARFGGDVHLNDIGSTATVMLALHSLYNLPWRPHQQHIDKCYEGTWSHTSPSHVQAAPTKWLQSLPCWTEKASRKVIPSNYNSWACSNYIIQHQGSDSSSTRRQICPKCNPSSSWNLILIVIWRRGRFDLSPWNPPENCVLNLARKESECCDPPWRCQEYSHFPSSPALRQHHCSPLPAVPACLRQPVVGIGIQDNEVLGDQVPKEPLLAMFFGNADCQLNQHGSKGSKKEHLGTFCLHEQSFTSIPSCLFQTIVFWCVLYLKVEGCTVSIRLPNVGTSTSRSSRPGALSSAWAFRSFVMVTSRAFNPSNGSYPVALWWSIWESPSPTGPNKHQQTTCLQTGFCIG